MSEFMYKVYEKIDEAVSKTEPFFRKVSDEVAKLHPAAIVAIAAALFAVIYGLSSIGSGPKDEHTIGADMGHTDMIAFINVDDKNALQSADPGPFSPFSHLYESKVWDGVKSIEIDLTDTYNCSLTLSVYEGDLGDGTYLDSEGWSGGYGTVNLIGDYAVIEAIDCYGAVIRTFG